MENTSFSQIKRIQFLAFNYSRLQGLRGLPPALTLFAVVVWANWSSGPAPRPILFPLLLAVAGMFAYWLIDRYYKKGYGRVVQAPRGHLEWLIAVGGGVLGLAAFVIDVTVHALPFLVVGLFMAIAILCDYLMLMRFSRARYLPIYPILALLIAVSSILPVFGLSGWWKAIGVKNQLLGVLVVSSALMAASSIVSHIYFTHLLPKEAPNGRSV
jgi:hypothetical protein